MAQAGGLPVLDPRADHVVGDRVDDVPIAGLALAPRLLCQLEFGYVLRDPEHVTDPARVVEDGQLRRVHDPPPYVRHGEGLLGHVHGLARLDHVPVHRSEERGLFGWRQALIVNADQLVPRVAHGAFGSSIHTDETEIPPVLDEHHRGYVLEDVRQEAFALLESQLGASLVGDVLVRTQDSNNPAVSVK